MDLVISELTPGGSTTPGLNPESTTQFQLWIWLCVILHICDATLYTHRGGPTVTKLLSHKTSLSHRLSLSYNSHSFLKEAICQRESSIMYCYRCFVILEH